MKYWNKKLKKAEEYIPGEQPVDFSEYIKLNTNENPFPPSASVLEALRKSCNESLRRYPNPTAFDVRKIFAAENGLEPENIFVSNGSDEIFTLIFRGFIEDRGTAAFPYPSYSLYETMAQLNGIKFERINLEKDFSFNLNNFLKKKYDLVIISNPNNPTGSYCEVDKIDKFLKSYEGLLVVDEAYIDFYGGSSKELVNKYDNIIVTRSLSKSYSLAGLRVGIAISNSDIIKGFMKIKDSYNIDSLAIAGAKAALMDNKGFKYNIQMLINNKDYLEDRLETLGFTIIPSRANFLFVKHQSIHAKKLFNQLKEEKILVRYFEGDRQGEYIRITVGTMMEIKEICKKLETILGA